MFTVDVDLNVLLHLSSSLRKLLTLPLACCKRSPKPLLRTSCFKKCHAWLELLDSICGAIDVLSLFRQHIFVINRHSTSCESESRSGKWDKKLFNQFSSSEMESFLVILINFNTHKHHSLTTTSIPGVWPEITKYFQSVKPVRHTTHLLSMHPQWSPCSKHRNSTFGNKENTNLTLINKLKCDYSHWKMLLCQ